LKFKDLPLSVMGMLKNCT